MHIDGIMSTKLFSYQYSIAAFIKKDAAYFKGVLFTVQ